MDKINTREKIKAALIECMDGKSLHQIQVKELVERSGVSRSSFYRNYDTIYDVAEEIEKNFLDSIREINRDCIQTDIQDMQTVDPYILATLHFIKGNQDILLALTGPYGDPGFREEVNKLLREFFLAKMAYHYRDVEYSDFYSVFSCSGHIDIIRYWLTKRRDVSEEQMAVIVAKLMYGYFFV